MELYQRNANWPRNIPPLPRLYTLEDVGQNREIGRF
jgi:hypothetical protein